MACTVSEVRELLAAEPLLVLPEGTKVLDVAERCRQGTLAFLRGASTWDKAELARWVGRHYRPLTAYVPRETLVAAGSSRRPMRADRVAELTTQAHAWVLGVARSMTSAESDVSFSYAAVYNGWIQRCRDTTGRPGWVPVDRGGLRLTERVLSLLTVDYLVRPADWLGGLAICRTCGAIEFDPAAKASGICWRHRPRVRMAG